jgi:hypothetical protein
MTIYEKLERLTRFSNKKALAEAAGLGPSALHNILARKGGCITTKTATALARVLGIDAGWLVDDRKPWPPVRDEHDVDCGSNEVGSGHAA